MEGYKIRTLLLSRLDNCVYWQQVINSCKLTTLTSHSRRRKFCWVINSVIVISYQLNRQIFSSEFFVQFHRLDAFTFSKCWQLLYTLSWTRITALLAKEWKFRLIGKRIFSFSGERFCSGKEIRNKDKLFEVSVLPVRTLADTLKVLVKKFATRTSYLTFRFSQWELL